MGNKSSVPEDSVGYRVLGVQPNSPAAKCGLVSFFDFIIAANGIPLKTLDTTFIELIKASEEIPLELTVYNCKNKSIRQISLTPSKNWPGEGMLGVTIRFDTFFEAEEHVCHVLDVSENSPADLAGLQPNTDYMLGTAEKVLMDTEILFQELQENLERPMEVYVYNAETDEVRVVVIMPSEEWGGEGILGANVACGYLHAIPRSCSMTLGKSNEGNIQKIVNSPFGHNSAAAAVGGLQTGTTVMDGHYVLPPSVQQQVHNMVDLNGLNSGYVDIPGASPASFHPPQPVNTASSNFFKVENLGNVNPHHTFMVGQQSSTINANA